MNTETIRVRHEASVCFIQFYRPEANNTINTQMIDEIQAVLRKYEASTSIVVFEGLPEVFCFGADFQGMQRATAAGNAISHDPEALYDLWLQLATGPFVSIANVRGKANAGGVGFVAACDIVLADESAEFSLSEMLFGLFPACVMPFLVRRVGFQPAHYMTLMTRPVSVQMALQWGLVDAVEPQSSALLRKHLLRLRRLAKPAIGQYKRYVSDLHELLLQSRNLAIDANREVCTDPRTVDGIVRYVETGRFPWEA